MTGGRERGGPPGMGGAAIGAGAPVEPRAAGAGRSACLGPGSVYWKVLSAETGVAAEEYLSSASSERRARWRCS